MFISFDLGISLLRIISKDMRYTWREVFRYVYPGIPPSSSKVHIPNGELNMSRTDQQTITLEAAVVNCPTNGVNTEFMSVTDEDPE